MLPCVVQNQAHRTLAHFGGILVRRLAHGAPSGSGVGASGKPGTVHVFLPGSLSIVRSSGPPGRHIPTMNHSMGCCTLAGQAAFIRLCVTHTTHITWGNLLLQTSLWFRRLRRTVLPASRLARLIERLVWQHQPASQALSAIGVSFFPTEQPMTCGVMRMLG